MIYEDLAVGDEVVVTQYTSDRILTVERITKTQIILSDGYKYSRENGRMITSERWHMAHIDLNKMVADVRAFDKRRDTIRLLTSFLASKGSSNIKLISTSQEELEETFKKIRTWFNE